MFGQYFFEFSGIFKRKVQSNFRLRKALHIMIDDVIVILHEQLPGNRMIGMNFLFPTQQKPALSSKVKYISYPASSCLCSHLIFI